MFVARDESRHSAFNWILVYQHLPDFQTCYLDSNREGRAEADTDLDHDPVRSRSDAQVNESAAETDSLQCHWSGWWGDGKRKGAAVIDRTPFWFHLVTRDSRLATQTAANWDRSSALSRRSPSFSSTNDQRRIPSRSITK